MHALSRHTYEQESGPSVFIQTTLYELINAINEAIAPGEEDLVVPLVLHLVQVGRVAFLGVLSNDDVAGIWFQ
jgi:hypothetical protein